MNENVKPICPLFGRCGGCQTMHLSAAAQLLFKQQLVLDAFKRMLLDPEIIVEACLASPSTLAYRNKIQLPVVAGPKGLQIGLFARNSRDLVEVEHCYVHCALGETVYSDVRRIILASGISAYDPKTGCGELRYVLIKTAVNLSQVLVVLVVSNEASETLRRIARDIITCCSSVQGVVQNIQRDPGNVVLGKKYHLLEGKSEIEECLSGLIFKISAASFFQVNTAQAELIYSKSLEFAELTGKELVLDAYCGVGTLALLASKRARRVVGIEVVPEAIADAQHNAERNEISNATFICGPVEKVISNMDRFDVVLLNPPRKGCEPSVLEQIATQEPKIIVYISCSPTSLARDLALLIGLGYQVEIVQPFDMFPQTAHVECVVKLRING